MIKTNVMRLLEQEKIPYRVMEYEVDETDLSGVHVARKLGIPEEQVFKTLAIRGQKTGIEICCIPVAGELDMKKVAGVCKDKKVEMLPLKELQGATGYIRGGCSPIGMKKKYPTYIDETAILFDEIYLSAGVRGMQIIIEPSQLIAYIDAIVADLTIE